MDTETKLEKERVLRYWSRRSSQFASLRKEELEDDLSGRWLDEIKKHIPMDRPLTILDAGTGSGYFTILLSRLGHHVTGVDLSAEMIKEAKKLAAIHRVNADFQVMDAENLEFPDQQFDIVISRNVIWTLPNPEHAYRHWLRVLKPGGILLNFDADYSEEATGREKLPEEHAHRDISSELAAEWSAINKQLPLGGKRPLWDREILQALGCSEIQIDTALSKRIYTRTDKFYNPNPMFSVRAVKSYE